MVPPNGWAFRDAQGVVHTSATLPELVQTLAQYRCRRGDDIGEPLREIIEYLCAQAPAYCRDLPDSATAAPRTKPQAVAKSERVEEVRVKPMEWRLAGWLRRQYLLAQDKKVAQKFVDPRVADSRAEICLKCPAYLKAGVSSCKVCSTTLEDVSAQLRAGRSTTKTSMLGACGKEGSDLRVDTLLARPADPEIEFPKECWKTWSR